MKKFKMIFATLMLGMAIVGGFQAYEYANIVEAGSVLLENVEALASGGDTPDTLKGQESDKVTCNGTIFDGNGKPDGKCKSKKVICVTSETASSTCTPQSCGSAHKS